MSNEVAKELKRIKKELTTYKRQLKQALAQNERLRSAIGYDELEGWKPQKRIETQYGWVYAWLYPLRSYLSQNQNKILSPDIQKKINEVVTAIIAQLVVDGKYGINFPHEPREVDIEQFMVKQAATIKREYEPCILCGETRITHDCHIIPRSEGGPLHKDNFITLCPLHHHLFDNARLSKTEWDKLCSCLDGKMEAAIVYVNEVRLPKQQEFWNEDSKNN